MKIRELESMLREAGFMENRKQGKGSHRKWFHPKLGRPVLLFGKSGDDAMPYQIKQVNGAISIVRS